MKILFVVLLVIIVSLCAANCHDMKAKNSEADNKN